ncbi:MAG: sialate O-acetylesterase [Phycisphaera sp.]|nr:sialate O-acetylesterase [Phycisphaera sp.]
MSKPVKVFIMMGQSNMVGMGHIAGKGDGTLEHAVTEEKLYPYLVDSEGNWAVRKDVRYVQVLDGGDGMVAVHNEWLQPDTTATKQARKPGQKSKVSDSKNAGKAANIMGPEFGIGHILGNENDAPIMLLKSCIGNRSLGWDLLPPGSKQFDFTVEGKQPGESVTYTYAGYKDSPSRWVKGTPPEERKVVSWYAGKQYDADVANAKRVLADFQKYYPDAKKYEIAGFFFWQGDKDRYDPALALQYEINLVNFIKSVRKDFNAPDAPFVLGTLGQTSKGDGGNEGTVLNAQLAVDGNSGQYPEFKGNVTTVYTQPMARGKSSNSHYGHDCRVYMDVGLAMGHAMSVLLKQVTTPIGVHEVSPAHEQ